MRLSIKAHEHTNSLMQNRNVFSILGQTKVAWRVAADLVDW